MTPPPPQNMSKPVTVTLFRKRSLQRESGEEEVTRHGDVSGPVTFGHRHTWGRRRCEDRQRLEGSRSRGGQALSPGGSHLISDFCLRSLGESIYV